MAVDDDAVVLTVDVVEVGNEYAVFVDVVVLGGVVLLADLEVDDVYVVTVVEVFVEVAVVALVVLDDDNSALNVAAAVVIVAEVVVVAGLDVPGVADVADADAVAD